MAMRFEELRKIWRRSMANTEKLKFPGILEVTLASKKTDALNAQEFTLIQTIKISPCVEMTTDFVIPTNGRYLGDF